MSRSRSVSSVNAWPGYVDALSALLMLVIFMLLIFTLAQVFLAETVSDRDEELNRLNLQLTEISDALRVQRQTNEDLSTRLTRLRSQYNQALQRQDGLEQQVSALENTVEDSEANLILQLSEKAQLQQDILALREVRRQLEDDLSQSQGQVGELRDRSQALVARLADEADRTLLAQSNLAERDLRIADLVAVVEAGEQALSEEKQLSASARADVARLSEQINALQAQLNTISNALQVAEGRQPTATPDLTNLGERLNTALALRVNELERYRSDFFAQLSNVLIDDPNLRVEGDRFLLPAELFFSSASATLGEAGKAELDKLAETLMDIARRIPESVDWILRIDGHTDQLPINTLKYPSNWELSTARAVAVVRYLEQQGIAPERMAATGFGEHYPINPDYSTVAFKQNRRIEIKLTNR